MKKCFVNWSGGKDCCLALYHIVQQKEYKPEFLFTTITAEYNRVTMHGVRKELITRQRFALGIPSRKMYLKESDSHEQYNKQMQYEMQLMLDRGIDTAVFGDIFLEDLRAYRERELNKVGIKAVFPLWKRNTKEVLKEFLDLGFKAIIVAADADKLGKEFAGRALDEQLIKDMPSGVDPCGENGEFHTFVYDGPLFMHPVKFKTGESILKTYTVRDSSVKSTSFWFTDLTPE